MEEILESFKIYLFETGRVTSNMTIQSYLGNIKQLLKWLNDENVDLGALDRMITLEYLSHIRKRDYKATTYNTKINSISNFNNYLKDQEIIEKDIIFAKDKVQLTASKAIDIYSQEEIKLIEAYIGDKKISQRDRLIIRVLKELALRVSELTNLKLQDIDLMGLEVEVHGKGNKRRVLPIKSKLAEDIREYISGERKENPYSSSKHLFLSERSSKIHRNTVLEVVKAMGKNLKITNNCYCHKFRHSLASTMADKGNVPIQVIQQFLGHSEIQTTIEYYVNIDSNQLKQAIENI